jgi:hypothetical protein
MLVPNLWQTGQLTVDTGKEWNALDIDNLFPPAQTEPDDKQIVKIKNRIHRSTRCGYNTVKDDTEIIFLKSRKVYYSDFFKY